MVEERAGIKDLFTGKAVIDFKAIMFILLLLVLILSPFWPIIMDLLYKV